MWLISLHCCKLFVYFELAVRDHLNDFIMCSCQLDIRLSDWGFWVKAAQSPAVQGLIASALSRDAVKTHRQLNHQLTELSHIHTQTHSSTSLSSLIPSCAPSLTAFLTKTCLASTSSQLSLSHTLSRSLTRTHTHTHRESPLTVESTLLRYCPEECRSPQLHPLLLPSAPNANSETGRWNTQGERRRGTRIGDDGLPEQAAELLCGDARPCGRSWRRRGALFLQLAARTSARIQLPALALSVHVHPAPSESQTQGFTLRELLEES